MLDRYKTNTDTEQGLQPRVLIGITTFNRAEVLPKAIASAASQSFPSFTVAVIDDCSTDATTDLAERFPRVEWKRHDRNRGLLAARNEFMSREGFEYFLSLDDDAWFLAGDEVELAIDYLEANPEVGAIAYDILSPDRTEAVPRAAACQVGMFIGCGHIVRLSVARQVGLYERLPGFYGGEEKDLCLRMLDAGYKVMLLPGVHVWHDKSEVSRNLPAQHASGVCNDLVFALRRTPVLWLLPVLLTKISSHLGFSGRNGLVLPCLKGIGLFLGSLGLWSTRRPVRLGTLRLFRQLNQSRR